MRSVLILALLAALLGGCGFGPRARGQAPVQTGRGVMVQVELPGMGRTLSGELLELRRDGLLLLASGDLLLVPLNRAGTVEAARAIGRTDLQAIPLDARLAERIRLFSRFPHGLPDADLGRLVERYGQIRPVEEAAGGAGVQPAPGAGDVDRFVAAARAGTARYRDFSRAVRDGYRLVGPDSPAMGEHWVHPSLLVAGDFDPAVPPILAYAPLPDGERRLIGVVYGAILTAPGEPAPPTPAPDHAWHDHAGPVDEEALALHRSDHQGPRPDGPRLAILHAWVWLENADGLFATDNWALPYARLGLDDPPEGAHTAAAKAVSLLTGGTAFYRAMAAKHGRLDATGEAAVARALTEAEDRVRRWFRDRPEGSPVDSGEAGHLAAIWAEVWDAVRAELGPAAGVWTAAVRDH